MDSERWEKVKRLVDEALSRDSAERERFLAGSCAGDEALRAEVESLLRHQEDSFLETEAAEAADDLVGRSLSHYRILGELGRGGMGRVYRARDERLGRSVAIKVLPGHFASDPQRLSRFEREARLIAALSHPHVATIHGLEHVDGAHFLVLELVRGETLQERLHRGRLPLKDALLLARQVAEALEAAHEKGVVHRDLKPSNVMVTDDGAVKVLDFGLAKALRDRSRDGEEDESATPPDALSTKEGIVMGTPAYMSPEQVGGLAVDHRTDVWSFGVLLWEMLAGRRLFDGESTAEVLGAVLRDEPAWDRLPDDTPAAVRTLLERCLTRDRRARLQAIGEARIVIEQCLSPEGRGSMPARVRRRRSAGTLVLAAAGLGLLGIGLGVFWLQSAGREPSLLQSTLLPPPGVQVDPTVGFALSPDGRNLAFAAQDADGVRRLWVRSLADLEARTLAGTEGAFAPFWSPDGRDIGFFEFSQALKRVPAAGGAVQLLAAGTSEPKGGTWSPDGRIVYVPDYRTGLFEIAARGGDPRALTTLASGELSHRWPRFLPDGRTLIFLVQTAEAGARDDRSRIEALEPSGTRHEVLRTNASAQYASSGHLLFWREGAIYAQELDTRRLRLRGEAPLLAAGVGLTLNEWSTFTVSDEGTLVYAPDRPWRLEWRQRSGRLLSVAAPEGHYSHAALSPDGRWLAYVTGYLTIRIRDLARGTDSRLTFEDVDHYSPAWSPQGDWLAYAANVPEKKGTEIYRRRSSGLGEREVLHSSATVVRVVCWSPDARWIAFEDDDDVFLLDLESRKAQPRLSTPAFEGSPAFSPDGRWLAYVSDESGRDEVYVVPAFDGPGRWQVSSEGGFAPKWGPGGTELFFQGLDSELGVVKVTSGEEPEFGLPEPLFALPGGANWTASYDLAADGRILMTSQVPDVLPGALKLVVNWPRLLQRPSR